MTSVAASRSEESLADPTDVTSFLVEVGRAVSFADLPTDVRERTKHSLLDTLGCLLGGTVAEPGRIIREMVLPHSRGEATVFGPEGARAGAVDAALINGVAAHSLDFDDANRAARAGHMSCTVFCAGLAIAETMNASGAELIAAVVAGYETAARLGPMLGVVHYAAGYHSTGTLGAFASAATAAHVLGLDVEQWTMALGIAGTQASGLRGSFGTMSKPLHAGRAASTGVLSALAAQRGFTGAKDIISGHNGFAETHAKDASDPEAGLRPLGRPYATETMNFKYHAACFGTHSAIDAMTRLRVTHQIDPDRVKEVVVRMPARSLDNCNIPNPQNGLEAKFSVRFTTAAALLGWDTTEAGFEDDAKITDPAIVSVINRTRIEGVPTVVRNAPTEVAVELDDGEFLVTSLDARAEANPWGSLEGEWDALAEKFRRLTKPVLSNDDADKLIDRLHRLEKLESVRQLTDGITVSS